MIASLLTLGNIGGINRPALSTVFRSLNGPVILLDIGANVDCRPAHIVQFAHMGSIYMEKVFGIQNPRVGLLSNGEESSKGSELVRKSHKLLSQNGLNFIGNVEGVEIPKGVVDVVVTDGFTGNAVAKVSEGLGEAFFEVVQGSKNKSFVHKLLSFVVRPYFRSLEKQALEWAGSGGSLLLGVEGTVVIGHGRSHAESVKKILEVAKSSAEQEVLETMKEDLRAVPISVQIPKNSPSITT
jgi:glycerol-3-phosphate acyltransferase PlsX